MISSIIPKRWRSFEVIFIAVAASSAFSELLQRIDAEASGEATVYIECSNIKTLLAAAKAMAPPEPHSPIIIDTTGTPNDNVQSVERAIASDCPRSSAPTPG